MIITLHKKIFSGAVATVARFSERRVLTLPALSGIAIEAKEKSITLRATNLETGIEIFCEGVVKKPGNVAIPANILKEITSSLSGDGMVTLEQSKETIILSTEKGKSTIKTLPYDDVPTLGIPKDIKTNFSIAGSTLRSLCSCVAGYASSSTVRPELASILFSAAGGIIKAVATDSFRLAEKKLSVSGSIPQFSLLIPAKNASDILQHIPDTEVKVEADDHQLAISWEGGVAVTRLVSLAYPDYQQIIPKSFLAEATTLKKDFEGALKRTSVFSDSFQKVRLGLDVTGKKIALSAHNTDIGESKEEVGASLTGEAIELSFNHRYLTAPLPSLLSESITLSAAGIGRPLIIRGTGDTSFLYLVMPMNQ